MLPDFATLKMLTSNGKSPLAHMIVANNTGLSPVEVKGMVALGAASLVEQAAQIKARPASPKRDAILCAARGAWLIAVATGVL